MFTPQGYGGGRSSGMMIMKPLILISISLLLFSSGIVAGSHFRELLKSSSRSGPVASNSLDALNGDRGLTDVVAPDGSTVTPEVKSAEKMFSDQGVVTGGPSDIFDESAGGDVFPASFRNPPIPDSSAETARAFDTTSDSVTGSQQAPASTSEQSASEPSASKKSVELPEATSQVDAAVEPVADAFADALPVRRARVLQLITEYLPSLSAVEAEVWADEWATLTDADVCFMLEQRKMLLGRQPLMSLPKLPESLGESNYESESTASGLESVISTIRTNLTCSHCPGYRRQCVVITPSSVTVCSGFRVQTVTDFSVAKRMYSGNPMHAALPDDPQMMFVLAGFEQDGHETDATIESCTVLTRKGDFEVLSDGRLGLRMGNRQLVLAPEVRIPPEHGSSKILADGRVVCVSSDGAETILGLMPVAKVQRPDQLRTDDGIFFRMNPGGRLDIMVWEDFAKSALRVSEYELSNVDHDEDWKALNHFRRLAEELKSSTGCDFTVTTVSGQSEGLPDPTELNNVSK